MIIKNKKTTKKDSQIDNKVISMANDPKAWGKLMESTPKSKPTSIRLNTRTIERAKFFSKIHHERGYQSWLKRIIEERIDTEFELYKNLRKEIL